MERISQVIEAQGEPLTFNGICERVTGKRAHLRRAVDALVSEGHLATAPGQRGATLHTLARPYREAEDRREPVKAGPSPNRLVTGSGSLGGEPGTSHLTGSGNRWGTGGEPVACKGCGLPLDPFLADAGQAVHVGCEVAR